MAIALPHSFSASSGEPPLRDLLAVVRRHLGFMLLLVSIMTALGLALGFAWPRHYTAATEILIKPRDEQIIDLKQVIGSLNDNNLSIDLLTATVQTEISLITRLSTVEAALNSLGLLEDPEFLELPPEDAGPGLRSRIKMWLNDTLLRRWDLALPISKPLLLAEMCEEAILRTRDALEVAQKPNSYVIELSYKDKDPARAAAIVNAVAGAYVGSQLAAKQAISERARAFLLERSEVLRLKLLEAEAAIQAFRQEEGLERGPKGEALDAQQLADLNAELILVRTDIASRQSRFDRLTALRRQGRNNTLLEQTLASPLLQRLRDRRLDLLAQQSELAEKYAERHPEMIRLRGEQRDLEQRIATEIDASLANLGNELALTRAREQALQEALVEARLQTATAGRANIRLVELERQADVDSQLYRNFLGRLGELQEQLALIQPDTDILDPARAPRSSSSPPALLFGIVGFVLSLGIGAIWIFARDQIDTRLRSSAQLEAALNIPSLGLVPRQSGGWRQLWPQKWPLARQLEDRPNSAFRETMRSLWAQLEAAHGRSRALQPLTPDAPVGRQLIYREVPQKGQVLLLSSALPDEGKTTIAAGLALAAAELQGKTLLIDLDLRRPSLARSFGYKPGRASKDQRLNVIHHSSRLDLLVDWPETSSPSALLSAPEMARMIEAVRDRYSFIIIDSPPILGLPDALLLADLADAVLLVTRWRQSTKPAVQAALKRLRGSYDGPVVGLVNDVVMRRQAKYHDGDESRFYQRYQQYYQS